MTTTADQLFKETYNLHHKSQDFDGAEEGYKQVISRFPESQEACYARTQLDVLERDREKLARKLAGELQYPYVPEYQGPVILTTAPSLEGYRIVKTLEVITAECAFGMNIFRDVFAAVTDIFGGRSHATQNVLRDARKACLSELRREAASIRANAVIAVDLDYSEFSGGGKSMLFLVASGTAVQVDKIEPAQTTDRIAP